MTKYILKDSKEKKIAKIVINESYNFNPKNNALSKVKYKSVTIYDESKIKIIINKQFESKYKKLMKLIKSVIDDETSSEDSFMICLNETEKLREVLENRYQKYLKKEKYDKFLQEIIFLRDYLVNKVYEIDVDKVVGGKLR